MMLAPEAAPAVTPVTAEMVAPMPVADFVVEFLPGPITWVNPEEPLQHAPPDLYLLNATLLV
jgi:hypothetical protein